jgi:lysosomal acid lipase/cholesteryl ester hydrolase
LAAVAISSSIRDASDFIDLCAIYGYYAEEHVLQTKDGYLLALHRLGWRKGEEDQRVNSGPKSIRKRVVYLHHGLLMNSEVWVCLTDEERALPFMLVEKGYDVWLGNNRGNKYSKKCIHCPPTSTQFWNFSMDEFAFHDIPESIAYILDTTSAPSLSYIGFSQGTAQAFATLAIHPRLNEQVDVFIALAPAMSPAGLNNSLVDALIKTSPQILFLLFGRRDILSSATMWQSILYPPIFVRLIDMGLGFLFGWKTKNMSTSQKLAAYPHLYSFTSTKSVVHWFQIMRNKSFQMYDDDIHRPLSIGSVSKYTKVARFPTRNIKTPIVLVYGGSDSLVDIGVMLKELPPHTIATEIPTYEHLDFLWARDVHELVFPHVMDALESFATAEHTKEEYATYRARAGSRSQSLPPPVYESEDGISPIRESYAGAASTATPARSNALASSSPRINVPSGFPPLNGRRRQKVMADHDSSVDELLHTGHVTVERRISEHTANEDAELQTPSPTFSRLPKSTRSGSLSSKRSWETLSLRGKGISVGFSKPTGGVVSRDVEGVGSVTHSSSDNEGVGARKSSR